MNRLLPLSLNPHVVGRFFRVETNLKERQKAEVLIPMWWGGFSEGFFSKQVRKSTKVLIPMWWGGFSESGGVFSLLNSNA